LIKIVAIAGCVPDAGLSRTAGMVTATVTLLAVFAAGADLAIQTSPCLTNVGSIAAESVQVSPRTLGRAPLFSFRLSGTP
jgi:hypothetical protein